MPQTHYDLYLSLSGELTGYAGQPSVQVSKGRQPSASQLSGDCVSNRPLKLDAGEGVQRSKNWSFRRLLVGLSESFYCVPLKVPYSEPWRSQVLPCVRKDKEANW